MIKYFNIEKISQFSFKMKANNPQAFIFRASLFVH